MIVIVFEGIFSLFSGKKGEETAMCTMRVPCELASAA